MVKNINEYERVFRFIFAVFICSMLFWGPRSDWALLGLIPMVTAVIGVCPFYWSMGVSTEASDPKKNHWNKKQKIRSHH